MAAEKIQARLNQLVGRDCVDIYNIRETALARSTEYPLIIYGISTWDFGELQEDWESSWQDISQLDLDGKLVALYGLGDQIGYTDWFQDALGMLHQELTYSGCRRLGYWPNLGYEFSQSKALVEEKDLFVGLSLDDENQYEQTDQRIEHWCEQLLAECRELNAVIQL
jgi:flavodoxin II